MNYGALEMAGRTPVIVVPNNEPDILHINQNISLNQPMFNPQVFISYNHEDMFAMRSVKNVLEDNGIDVFVDIQNPAFA